MFRTFIDEAEIEEWFEEEKQTLSQWLYDQSFQKKDIDKAKKLYDKKFSLLLKRYDWEHRSLTKRLERKRRLQKPIDNLKSWWKHKKSHVQKRWHDRYERLKKWRFDREYSRLMKK